MREKMKQPAPKVEGESIQASQLNGFTDKIDQMQDDIYKL